MERLLQVVEAVAPVSKEVLLRAWQGQGRVGMVTVARVARRAIPQDRLRLVSQEEPSDLSRSAAMHTHNMYNKYIVLAHQPREWGNASHTSRHDTRASTPVSEGRATQDGDRGCRKRNK